MVCMVATLIILRQLPGHRICLKKPLLEFNACDRNLRAHDPHCDVHTLFSSAQNLISFLESSFSMQIEHVVMSCTLGVRIKMALPCRSLYTSFVRSTSATLRVVVIVARRALLESQSRLSSACMGKYAFENDPGITACSGTFWLRCLIRRLVAACLSRRRAGIRREEGASGIWLGFCDSS